MSDEEIRVLCRRLAALLADPHPGLATWTAARNTAAQRLRDALNEVCEAPTTTDPITAAEDPWRRALREMRAEGATIAALVVEAQDLVTEGRALVAAARQRLTGPEMRERIRAKLICAVEPAAAESAFVVFGSGPDAGGRFADAIMALLVEAAS